MIFLTVGTQLPFDRLVRAVDVWCGQNKIDGFAQIAEPGPKGYFPQHLASRPFLRSLEFDDLFYSSDIVVAHAGMGSIIAALMIGKPIVVMPRRAALMEHRNDHQMATVNRFQDRPNVHVAMDERDLPDILGKVLQAPEAVSQDAHASRPPLGPYADRSLIEAIRTFILDGKPEHT